MANPYEPLEFYASLLRDEIRSADNKVGIAVASSSILLSANFLTLRAGALTLLPATFVLLATATALTAVVCAILAVRPGMSNRSKGLYYFRNLQERGAQDLRRSFEDSDIVLDELAVLCADYARIAQRKYALVRVSLNFLMASACATAATVMIRYGQQGTQGLP